jgi:hypothetical protein
MNDKDPGNVSMLQNLPVLSFPAQLEGSSFQSHLDMFKMVYKVPDMNEAFDPICFVFEPFDNKFFSPMPESKTSLQLLTEKATATTKAKFFLTLVSADIPVLRCEVDENTYKTLLSKHVGFASLYDTSVKTGSQLFMLFARSYNQEQPPQQSRPQQSQPQQPQYTPKPQQFSPQIQQQPRPQSQPQQPQQPQQPIRAQSQQIPHFSPQQPQTQQFGGSGVPSIGHKCVYTSNGTPYNATVKSLNGRMVTLGFDGYEANWDQTVDYDYQAISQPQWKQQSQGPCVGQKCIYTSNGTPYNATVKSLNGRMVTLGFDGYEANWDQTVDYDYQAISQAQWKSAF